MLVTQKMTPPAQRQDCRIRGCRFLWACSLLLVVVACTDQTVRGEVYNTQYYEVHTDLPPERAQDAILRMSLMFEEYRARTLGSRPGRIRKLPFYLFSNAQDYYANGGMPGSAGVFTGDKLMAFAGEQSDQQFWHVVQHEGFHQFVREGIGGDIPIWVNEGLAEYFGEAVFTGHGYVAGLIPKKRLERVRNLIKEGRFKTIEEMMLLSHMEWNFELNFDNYDLAWSMIQFLGHAHEGRYQGPFERFLDSLGAGTPYDQAWLKHFGAGTKDFEAQWKSYWIELPDDPMPEKRAEVTVATLTSFLARAASQKQRFTSAEEFFLAAREGRLHTSKAGPQPACTLLSSALADAEGTGEWKLIGGKGRKPKLQCTLSDGTVVEGSFTIARQDIKNVSTTVKKPRQARSRRPARRPSTRRPNSRP